ncbi:MAG TPA: hypothetical protein VE615_07145 [Gaiellaceae bacterium]|nr:hypothetical protein [Gaiellaceae bacterium]
MLTRLFVFLFAFVAFAVSPALAGRPVTDGTLSVKDGKGVVQLSARGSLIGRFERGKVTITDPNPYDARRPTVLGAEVIVYRSAKTTVYSGRDVRIRIGGGLTHVKIEGRGIYVSAVGRGTGMINGSGSIQAGVFYDGVWSLNDDDYRSLPDDPTAFQLAALRSGD